MRTLRKDLPLASFRPSIGRHGFIQIFKEILHLATTLPLCKFVADSQFWRSAVIANALCVHALMLQARDGAVLQRMVVGGRRFYSRVSSRTKFLPEYIVTLFCEPTLSHGHLRIIRENATANR